MLLARFCRSRWVICDVDAKQLCDLDLLSWCCCWCDDCQRSPL